MKQYPEIAVEYLRKESDVIDSFGAPVIVKKSPGEGRAGTLDHWEHKELTKTKGGVGGEAQSGDKSQYIPDIIARAGAKLPFILRAMTDNAESGALDLCLTRVSDAYEEIEVNGRKVGLWRYEKKSTRGQARKCFINIHGGGFFMGTADDDRAFCRLIAERSGAVVFNIDYSLSPEVRYPTAVEECFAVLEHVVGKAAVYEIDPDKIAIGGASGGGNLSAAVTLMARDRGMTNIALQALMVPLLLLADTSVEGYAWSAQDFEMADETKAISGSPVDPIRDPNLLMMMDWYIDESKRYEPYASPLLCADVSGLPKTLICTCEFDSLRHHGEFYGSMLSKAGISTRIVRYKGCTHPSTGRLGLIPQAEDCVNEIVTAMAGM